MSNRCPKCGASWNGLQYACGSQDSLFTGFVQSEQCLADEKAPEFETINEQPVYDVQLSKEEASVSKPVVVMEASEPPVEVMEIALQAQAAARQKAINKAKV